MNTITLIGYVGKDAECRTFDNGGKVANFTFATTERGYTLQNGTQVPEQTDWHNVVCNRMEAALRQEETTAVASRLLDDYVASFNERMRRSIESGRRRNGRAYGPVGEIIGHLPIRPDLPFDEKLRTLFAYVNNSCLDSFYHVSQERALRQELEDMRAMCQGFVERFEGRFGNI